MYQAPAIFSPYPQQLPPPQFFPDQFPEPEVKSQCCGMFFAGSHLIGSVVECVVNFMILCGILATEVGTNANSILGSICALMHFIGSVSETTFFGRVIFDSSYISGNPPASRFGFLGFTLLIRVVNIIIMFSTDNIIYKISGSVLIFYAIGKLIDYAIIWGIYGQDDHSNGSCCLCLKPWIQESPRLIHNYLMNHFPPPPPPPPPFAFPLPAPAPVPIVFPSAVHPVPISPVLNVNYLPNAYQKY